MHVHPAPSFVRVGENSATAFALTRRWMGSHSLFYRTIYCWEVTTPLCLPPNVRDMFWYTFVPVQLRC